MFVHPPHKRTFVTTKSAFWVKLNFVEGKVGETALYVMKVSVEIKSSVFQIHYDFAKFHCINTN